MDFYKRSLFVFRSDLRVEDNRGLQAALMQSGQVACLFIVDPAFNTSTQQRKLAKTCLLNILALLNESLEDKSASLWLAFGKPEELLQDLVSDYAFDAVFANKVYTDKGRERDAAIASALKSQGIPYLLHDDYLLFPPGFILKKDGTPYTVFTPFYKFALQFPIEKPSSLHQGVFMSAPATYNFEPETLADYWQVDKNACVLPFDKTEIDTFLRTLQDYDEERDYPALDATTGFSIPLRYGLISVRQAYAYVTHALGADSPILRQFYWRDFFHHVAYHFPHVFSSAFREQYKAIPWGNNPEYFEAWKKGCTGFPLVDAGMRQLNETGYMHNRVRMVVASFLVKDLHIDWRWGEQYFKERLLDYDAAVNNGNWQWAASTGCDAQPYFRIFNPWRQQERFDADATYIKRWVPELEELPAKQIHQWFKSDVEGVSYPRPIVDHGEQAAIIKQLFKDTRATA